MHCRSRVDASVLTDRRPGTLAARARQQPPKPPSLVLGSQQPLVFRLRGAGDDRSALGVFLCRPRLELEPDEPLVADDPRVVARLDDVRVAWADLDLGSVLVLDGQPAGVDNSNVASLAALG